MLNFDFTLKIKDTTYEIKNNTEVNFPSKISAPNVNKIIEAYLAKIKTYLPTGLGVKIPFAELVNDIKYLEIAEECLVSLKRRNCFNGKTYCDHKDLVSSLKHKFFNEIIVENYSKVECAVIWYITKDVCSVDLYNSSEEPRFNLSTEDSSELEELEKEYNNFPWDTYSKIFPNLSNFHESINHKFKIIYEDIKKLIELKRKFTPEQIINWQQAKITIEMRAVKLNKCYEYHRTFKIYQFSLLNSGVKTKVQKECKDNIALFKQASKKDLNKIVSRLTLEEIYKLIDSDLVCVKQRFGNLDSRKRILAGDPSHGFVERILAGDPSQQRYDYLIKIGEKINWQLPFPSKEIFSYYLDFLTTEHFEKWAVANNRDTFEVSEHLFDKVISKVSDPLNLNVQVTYEFIMRMSVEEKIKTLPTIDQRTFESNKFPELFANVNWKILRKYISNNEFYLECDARILKEGDIESAVLFLKRRENKQLIKIVPFERKREIYIDSDNYNTNPENLFTQEEMLIVLEEWCKKDEKLGELSHILDGINESYAPRVQKILNRIPLRKFPLTRKNIALIDSNVALKVKLVHILQLMGCNDYVSNSYDPSLKPILKKYFANFTRKDVEENDLMGSYFYYLAHTMTSEELVDYAERRNDFLRFNLDVMPLSYLIKFKDEQKFKEVVGSRVHRLNKIFAAELSEKLKIPNSIEYILED